MPRAPDQIDRAHLRDARGFSPPVYRLAPPPDLTDVVRRFWIPVWSLPAGEATVQRVLRYPVCQVVVASDYAQLVGPAPGLATKRLSGTGWVVGAMLQPAPGAMLFGTPLTQQRDQVRDLTSIGPLPATELIAGIRDAMAPDPGDPARRAAAAALLAAALRELLPVDREGLLVNAVVEYVEGDRGVRRVGQVCAKFAISERSLQRVLARRVGLSPKWLIQRRRLHEAVGRLRAGGGGDLARVASELGYTDQAHFSRDFRTVTGMTPGAFAAEPRT